MRPSACRLAVVLLEVTLLTPLVLVLILVIVLVHVPNAMRGEDARCSSCFVESDSDDGCGSEDRCGDGGGGGDADCRCEPSELSPTTETTGSVAFVLHSRCGACGAERVHRLLLRLLREEEDLVREKEDKIEKDDVVRMSATLDPTAPFVL